MWTPPLEFIHSGPPIEIYYCYLFGPGRDVPLSRLLSSRLLSALALDVSLKTLKALELQFSTYGTLVSTGTKTDRDNGPSSAYGLYLAITLHPIAT